MIKHIEALIEEFIDLIRANRVEIYNEFSLQHELGAYLRSRITDQGYKIQFERNVSYFGISKYNLIKKEIDLSIFNEEKNTKIAIELKYPVNGQYPETMYSFVKDIRFCEQLTQSGFDSAISLTVVNDRLFYSGGTVDGIYQYFREGKPIAGIIAKPTGVSNDEIVMDKEYLIRWKELDESSKYYTVVIERDTSVEARNQIGIADTPPLISTRKFNRSDNSRTEKIREHIRDILIEAKENDQVAVELLSGEVHNDLGLDNAMPSVCNAMYHVMEEFPGSEVIKPPTVVKYSSTIKVIYKLA